MPHAVTRPNLYAPRPRPMGEMNVTPFIDVLLVLLIMLILAIAADRLLWNGAPVSPAILRAQVAAASAEEHPALLRFAPDANASYDTAARTIALIKEEGAKSFAFVGNEQHRNFGI